MSIFKSESNLTWPYLIPAQLAAPYHIRTVLWTLYTQSLFLSHPIPYIPWLEKHTGNSQISTSAHLSPLHPWLLFAHLISPFWWSHLHLSLNMIRTEFLVLAPSHQMFSFPSLFNLIRCHHHITDFLNQI